MSIIFSLEWLCLVMKHSIVSTFHFKCRLLVAEWLLVKKDKLSVEI